MTARKDKKRLRLRGTACVPVELSRGNVLCDDFGNDGLKQASRLVEEIVKDSKQMQFDLERLGRDIERSTSFKMGLISYLKAQEKRLENNLCLRFLTRDEKLNILEILIECGSFLLGGNIFMDGFLPDKLKSIEWEKEFKKRKQSINLTASLESLNVTGIERTVLHFVLLACGWVDETVQGDSKKFGSSIDESGNPKILIGSWISKLKWVIVLHFNGLKEKKRIYGLADGLDIEGCSEALSLRITQILFEQKFVLYYKSRIFFKKSPGYVGLNWPNTGKLPRNLFLPMVCPPKNWEMGSNKTWIGADETVRGGYLLSRFSSMSLVGDLENCVPTTDHHLLPKSLSSINRLQSVAMMINKPMLSFLNRFKDKLTDEGSVLLSDRWLGVSKSDFLGTSKDWERLSQKRHLALSNLDMLKFANYFSEKLIYWPVTLDFRGRIYRNGSLNYQASKLFRSLITFTPRKLDIGRRRRSYWLGLNEVLGLILEKPEAIEKWEVLLKDKSLIRKAFERLLLEDYVGNRLSLIQISQLLLIREGESEKVGVFLDATASAYQIIGAINGDVGLSKETNVLASDSWVHGVNEKKHDFYKLFIDSIREWLYNCNEIGLTKFKLNQIEREIICSRKSIKSIVMPLIYGKKVSIYGKKLRLSWEEKGVTLDEKTGFLLEKEIQRRVKEHPILKTSMVFMKMMRVISGMLCDMDSIIIRGPYYDSSINYYKKQTKALILESKDLRPGWLLPKRLREKSYGCRSKSEFKALQKKERIKGNAIQFLESHGIYQKTVLQSKVLLTNEGKRVRSKGKSRSSFIANYVHFLDGTICHFVTDRLSSPARGNVDFNLATIHDCFYTKPEEAGHINAYYRTGLVICIRVHHYNLLKWLSELVHHENCHGFDKTVLLFELDANLRKLGKPKTMVKGGFKTDMVATVEWNEIVKQFIGFKKSVGNYRQKKRWGSIITYLEYLKETDFASYLKDFIDKPIKSVYPANK
jgi:hypothetical protein